SARGQELPGHEQTKNGGHELYAHEPLPWTRAARAQPGSKSTCVGSCPKGPLCRPTSFGLAAPVFAPVVFGSERSRPRCSVSDPRSTDALLAALVNADGDDRESLDRLVPLVYAELRKMAHRQLAREHERHTLDTTALVHEAYVRLVDASKAPLASRAYFFGAAARAMRQVLVDAARRRRRKKRGEGRRALELSRVELAVDGFAAELVDLDEALECLARE